MKLKEILFILLAMLTVAIPIAAQNRKNKNDAQVQVQQPAKAIIKPNLYLLCDALTFNTHYTQMEGAIKSQLAKDGYKFVFDRADANCIIVVTAITREGNQATIGSITSYFCYVDAKITIEKGSTLIYEDVITEKGAHTTDFEQAAMQAFRTITPKVAKTIEEQISINI